MPMYPLGGANAMSMLETDESTVKSHGQSTHLPTHFVCFSLLVHTCVAALSWAVEPKPKNCLWMIADYKHLQNVWSRVERLHDRKKVAPGFGKGEPLSRNKSKRFEPKTHSSCVRKTCLLKTKNCSPRILQKSGKCAKDPRNNLA